ncbi:hypothetical protein [Roseibacillus persicicus]|uniref:hypothetical protein n=1 Tax=Roseibacillus persicicus TaxID=454148 RepID=UPI00280E62AE|nr:hypothetical protein [Roseibacillus persicicus]MDQ8189627.1 hypothetical protein [Roseibacillus persicicus]
MKQERKEELVIRWMDDEVLSASENEELKRILEAEPELTAMRAGHSQVREDLLAVYAEPADVPYGDFFQTKLEQAIRDADEADLPPAKPTASSWRDALRWWLAPVAVGAMAVAFLAGTRVGNSPTPERLVVSQNRSVVYTPEGGVTASIVNADGAGTSVIVLDGLQPIPDSFDLMAGGQSFNESDSAVQLISTQRSVQVY